MSDAVRPLSRLADQALLAAAVAYYRDVHTVLETQKKAAGMPPTRIEDDPKREPRNPRGPKAKAKAAAAAAEGAAS